MLVPLTGSAAKALGQRVCRDAMRCHDVQIAMLKVEDVEDVEAFWRFPWQAKGARGEARAEAARGAQERLGAKDSL